MPSKIYVESETPVVWADSTDYSNPGGLARTHQLNMESVANGAARQGAKADLGNPRAARYSVLVGVEAGASAPTAGGEYEFWWSSSPDPDATDVNAGGASGSDGAYKAGEEDEWKRQLIYVGSLIVTNDGAGTVQRQCINTCFVPPTQYGMPVFVNKSGQTVDTDATNMWFALVPLADEAQ
jgi:hypothetical protein